MSFENDDVLVKPGAKHVVALLLFIIIMGFTLFSYVNAWATYRPTIVSQYIPSPPPNLFPVADAGPDQEVFVNQMVYFDGSGSEDSDGTIALYSWSFGDGESVTGESVSYRYDAEGVYEVTLTVTDDDGATNNDVLTVTVREPTPELLSPLSPEEAAAILEGIRIEAALDVLVNLDLTHALEVARALDSTTFLSLVEAAVSLDQTADISRILIELEEVTEVLLSLDPAVSTQILGSMTELNSTKRDEIIETIFSINENKATIILGLLEPQLLPEILIDLQDDSTSRVLFNLNASYGTLVLESMVGLNVTKSALVVETMVSSDLNKTAGVLELMDTQALLEVLIEITQLNYSPSTAAAIIESLSIEKAVELSKAWISTADIQELGVVWKHLSSEALNSIFEDLEISERLSIYPYLSSETVSMIQIGLMPLPDVTVTSFTINRVGSRSYHLNGTIENLGNWESGTFMTDLLIDDELVEQFQFSSLLPEESTTFTFEWKPTSRGVYAFDAIIDTANKVKEINENNNMVTRMYGVELPDITVSLTIPLTEYIVGNSYTLNVEVSNIGEEEATGFDLTVEGSGIIIENGDVRWVPFDVGSSMIESLPPDVTKSLEFSWTPKVAGAYTIEAKADPLEQILEGVRENNVDEINVEVEKKQQSLLYTLTLIGITIIAAGGAIYFYREKISSFISKYVKITVEFV